MSDTEWGKDYYSYTIVTVTVYRKIVNIYKLSIAVFLNFSAYNCTKNCPRLLSSFKLNSCKINNNKYEATIMKQSLINECLITSVPN